MTKPERTVLRGRRYAALVLVILTVALLASAAVGTVTAQETVSNAQEMNDVRDDLDGDYVLTDDIDLSGTANFEPIGDFNDPFTGTFDGNGHSITGLTIDRTDEFDIGLFGGVGSGGSVKNVSVENVDVDGEQWVGGLVGFNQGDITDSYATGKVVADTRTGGLAGGNEGSITDSYARGEITSVDIAGGLVGRNVGDIRESHANVSVAGFEGVTARDMGGLVGVNIGTVRDSYARGEVIGDRFLGGLVGASDGDIIGSYATGEVVGSDDIGGLVGDLNFDESEATLRDSYWDEEETAQTDAFGTQSGSPTVQNVEGLGTNEMKGDEAETNMNAFDFTAIWRTVTNPDGYPVLAWQVGAAGNQPPSASFTYSPNSPNVSETVTFDASGSSDSDGSIVLYEWDFDGDGTIDSQVQSDTIDHVYSSSGDYTVTLRVTDDSGATDSVTQTVSVGGDGGSGSLSPNNPFGDSSNNPVSRSTVINRVVEWNLNDTINGTAYTRSEIIGFIVEWNLAR